MVYFPDEVYSWKDILNNLTCWELTELYTTISTTFNEASCYIYRQKYGTHISGLMLRLLATAIGKPVDTISGTSNEIKSS
jgi:hypothetical protein